MPRVGSDRGQIGLDRMGSDWTNSDWIDSAQFDPDRGRLGSAGIGSEQLGSHRPRFHLGSRYLRARDIRYPRPNHHGHRTPEKAEKKWRIVSDGCMVKCSIAVALAIRWRSRPKCHELRRRQKIISRGQIRVGHDEGASHSDVRYSWRL